MLELEGVMKQVDTGSLKENSYLRETCLFFCPFFLFNFTVLMFVFGYQAKGKYISKRMTLLQDMVPGCNRITGKAVMLDKIIEYVSETSRGINSS